MTVQSVLGARVGSYDVELAAIQTLTERLPTYLDAAARRRGIDPTATGFPTRPAQLPFSRKAWGGWPESRLPAIQVVCSGMAERPVRQEDGLYTTWWQLEVFCVVSARDHAATRRVRSVYEDAIGWCLLQRRSLGGIANGMDWLGESSADVPSLDEHDERTLQGTVIVVVVEVPDCLDPDAGPAVFIPDAGDPLTVYPDDPSATDVVLTLTPTS